MKYLPIILVSLSVLISTQADLMYVESGGTVSGEAEIFTSRVSNPDGRAWMVVPDEAVGSTAMVNARNGSYIAALPDLNIAGNGPLLPAAITYKMLISTPGTYRLYNRWAKDTNIGGGGNSDSWFSDIIELKDGTGGAGGPIADWYEQTNITGGDFAANGWDGGGQAEVNQAGDNDSPVTWNIPSPGIYTLRYTIREDGVAADAFVFQLSNRPAPTGDGPALSQIIPEPSSFALLLGGLALLIGRRITHLS